MTPSTLLHPLKLDVVGFQEDEHDYHFRVELPEPKCCQSCGTLYNLVKFGKDDQADLFDFAGSGCVCSDLRNGGHANGCGHRHPRRSALPPAEIAGLAGAERAPQGNGAAIHRR